MPSLASPLLSSRARGFARTTRFLAAAALLGPAWAQCAIVAAPGGPLPDADGAVYASCAFDPDGPGPLPLRIALGGAFRTIGGATSRGIAWFDPSTGECASLATGIGGTVGPDAPRVAAVVALPNGDLVIGGQFTSAGAAAVVNVARWDGTAFVAMGASVPFVVHALHVLANGDVVAAGSAAAGVSRVLRWDGASWLPMGGGLTGTVSALASLPNGDVVAGGSVVLPGGANLARWNGVAWTSFPGGVDAGVLALSTLPNGDLVAAGGFVTAGGSVARGIARWDGTAWAAFGSGIPNPVYAVLPLPNGELIAGGLFANAGGVPANQVARWNGTAWSSLGGGLGFGTPTSGDRPVRTLQALPGGELLGAGSFTSANGATDHVAKWNGSAWGPLRPGTDGAVLGSAEASNGDLFVVGEFLTIEGVPASRVARRSGTVWQPLGAGANGTVHAVLPLPNGDVVIGGSFTAVGGVAAAAVARWDGSSWHALGGGLPAVVHSLAAGPGGQILASGTFLDMIAVWNGGSWSGTGIAGSTIGSQNLRKLLARPDGVYAPTGAFTGTVGRWDGVVWTPVTGQGVGPGVVAFGPLGEIYATSGSGVRRWTGSAWVGLGIFNAVVNDLAVLPDGDLVAAGEFTAMGTTPLSRLARWDGSAWTAIGAGASAAVAHLRWSTNGRLFVAGAFAQLLGSPAASFGDLVSSCPASAAVAGSGCTGSGGANGLAATSLPWLGATFTSRATGLPPLGVAVEVLGLGALTQPLAALLPQGVAGCVLSATPDLLNLHVPVAGALELQLVVPASLGLVGASLRQQVVPFEFDAVGSLLAVTASNALQLTIGQF